MRVELDEVERWWPVGYGDPVLYDVRVRLGADGRVLDETTRRVGFRDLRWNTEPDADGTPFQLVVNDQPMFVKGANWIPDDAFPVRVDRRATASDCEQARAAGLNLIRVWGGGIYEADAFYELCDELGLLTWQDFLFACAAYSEEEPLRVRGRGRGAREHRAPRAPRLALPAHRQQREPVGLRGLGLEAAPRRPDLGRSLLPRAVPDADRRARAARAVRARKPVQPRRRAPERRAARHHARLGPLEPEGLAALPRHRAALRGRVRVAGPAGLVDAHPRDQRRPAHARVAGDDRAPEGDRRQRQAHRRARAALPRARRHGDLALGHAAQPGQRGLVRARPLPLARAEDRRRRGLAAQRLLARDLVGRHRRRRPREAAVPRHPQRVRAAGRHRSNPGATASPRWSGTTRPTRGRASSPSSCAGSTGRSVGARSPPSTVRAAVVRDRAGAGRARRGDGCRERGARGRADGRARPLVLRRAARQRASAGRSSTWRSPPRATGSRSR